jgi:hypothetical protein
VALENGIFHKSGPPVVALSLNFAKIDGSTM